MENKRSEWNKFEDALMEKKHHDLGALKCASDVIDGNSAVRCTTVKVVRDEFMMIRAEIDKLEENTVTAVLYSASDLVVRSTPTLIDRTLHLNSSHTVIVRNHMEMESSSSRSTFCGTAAEAYERCL